MDFNIEEFKLNIEKLSQKYPDSELLTDGNGYSNRPLEYLNKFEQVLSKYDYKNEVIKTEEKNIKDMANRFIESYFNKMTNYMRNHFFDKDKWEYKTDAGNYIMNEVHGGIPYAHTIPGKLKKASMKKKVDQNAPEVITYKEFCEAIIPLSDMLKELKTKIVKKKAADLEKAEAKQNTFHKVMSHQDVVKTNAVLEGITTNLKEEIFEKQKIHISSVVAKIKEEINNGKLYVEFHKDTDEEKKFMLQKISNNRSVMRTSPVELKPQEEINKEIEKVAKNNANFIVDEYKARVIDKVAPIVAKKDNLERVRMNGYRTTYGKIESTMDFNFKDGSSFSLDSGSVFSYSKYGKPFLRHPSLFKDIIMPNGNKMDARPSEENMHEVFLKENNKKTNKPKMK